LFAKFGFRGLNETTGSNMKIFVKDSADLKVSLNRIQRFH
jgi:hypothetical protein